MPHSKKNTPALVVSKTGATCVVNTGSKFVSQNFDSTFGCFDANPRMSSQKETPDLVRGKSGEDSGTIRNFAVPSKLNSTSLHLGVARAYVVHKNLLVDSPKIKPQRRDLPLGAGEILGNCGNLAEAPGIVDNTESRLTQYKVFPNLLFEVCHGLIRPHHC